MIRWLTFLLLFASLSAKEIVLDTPENDPILSTPLQITPRVNPITGDYIEESVDLIVAGIEPLSVRRFYSHSTPYEPRYMGWLFNPETYLAANFELPGTGHPCFAAIGERWGRILSLEEPGSYSFTAKDISIHPGTGQTHPLNIELNYCRTPDPKNKKRFRWDGKIIDGSGTLRYFTSPMHTWKNEVPITRGNKTFLKPGKKSSGTAHPAVWTPYYLNISEERRPNGNIIEYSYVHWKENPLWPTPLLINTITAYTPDRQKMIGQLIFKYHRDKNDEVIGMTVTGSDNRSIYISSYGKNPIMLSSVNSSNPDITYHSQGDKIVHVNISHGCFIQTAYDSNNKVAAQYAPVGPNGDVHPIGQYTYHQGATEVFDAENNKTVYRYDNDNRLLSTEIYDTHTHIYRINRQTWDTTTGNLLQKTLEDGIGNILLTTHYTYDKNHNVTQEKTGHADQWRTLTKTYSDDDFNLLLSETDREGKLTKYTYKPNTNLLTSQIVYNQNKICKRTFNFYDDCAICIKTITDDGTTLDPYDLTNVTYRTIKEITPKQETPCFGLPETIHEKTIDAQGNEILLHKTHYTYTPFGSILQETHFDSQNQHRFTLYNTYDDKERLTSKTDALGNTTTFTYDINYNLDSISGPKQGQHKHITYDKANRPIQTTDTQTDDTTLTTQKHYDKLGQVICEIDPCGQQTHIQHDPLGRVIAVTYPNGDTQKRNYDLFDNIIEEIDAKGFITRKTYNPFGQPTAIYYPDGSEEHFTYNPTGTLATQTDKNGTITHYTYDIFDRPIQTQTPYKVTTATYTPLTQLTQTDPQGTVTTWTYDYAGRKLTEQIGTKLIHNTYDTLGNLIQTQEGDTFSQNTYDYNQNLLEQRAQHTHLQFQESYNYNEKGDRTQVITSKGIYQTHYNTYGKPLLEIDPLGNKTHYTYNYLDTLIETKLSPKGIQTITTYDTRGRITDTSKKNQAGELIYQTQNTYDANNNLTDQTHFVFNQATLTQTITHHWDYGPMDRLEKSIEAGNKATLYTYDPKGRLQTITKPSGVTVSHEYDHAGRLSRYYSHDFDYHYTYDLNDRVTSIHDAITNQTTTRSYDTLGNITQEILATGLTFTNSYTPQGRRSTLTLPDDSTISYTYQGAFLYQVERNGYQHTYSRRDLDGHLTQATLPAKLGQLTTTRDPLSRPTDIQSQYFSSSDYIYDPEGCLLSYSYQDLLGLEHKTFQYDDLNQLTSEDEHTYQADSLNNRLKKDDAEHTINEQCQILNDGKQDYVYDLDGNLIHDNDWIYSYDSLDRLITLENTKTRIEYTYDPFHRRLSKTVYANNKQTQHQRYLWDGEDEIGVINDQNTIEELRILGEGLGAEIGAAILYELKGRTYIPLHDHRGCVVTLIDPDKKQATQCYRYTAFGEQTTPYHISPWRFSSKRIEEETGLIYFGRRYYMPQLGRWMTQDPEGFDDGPNKYAYLHNNPLMDYDLYGLFSMDHLVSTFYSCFGIGGTLVDYLGLGFYERNYSNYDTYFDNRSRNHVLSRPELSVGEIGRTNGVLNRYDDAEDAAIFLSNVAGRSAVHWTHNETHGIGDFHETGLNLRGVATSPVFKIQDRWTAFFDKSPPGVPYYEECHSQGTALVKCALESYPKELRDRIIVRAFAPSAYISSDLCMDVRHFCSDGDLVHLIDFKGRKECADTITMLPRHPDAPRFLDHSISSPTFAYYRKQELNIYLKKLNYYK